MAQNFRNAFNGFNKEDVVHYLEFINKKHTEQVNQLTAEAEDLRRQLETLPDTQALEAQIAELKETVAQLESQLAEASTAPAAPALPTVPVSSSADQELEAYRRAERVERIARERAELVYRQTNGVLADATAKVDDAAAQIGTITEQVMTQLTMLQKAVDGSKLALKDAAATMYQIRPAGKE